MQERKRPSANDRTAIFRAAAELELYANELPHRLHAPTDNGGTSASPPTAARSPTSLHCKPRTEARWPSLVRSSPRRGSRCNPLSRCFKPPSN